MLKLQIIVGSTRDNRNADAVCQWLLPMAQSKKEFDVEVLDLRDWPLPFFKETIATVGDFANPTYSDPLVKRWNEKIREADAYLVITPEYNRSIPAVLKNAFDSVFFSFAFRHKPVACVSYSLGFTAGVRAADHLNQIMIEAEAVPIRTQTLIPLVGSAFDAEGQPTNPVVEVTLSAMLDDLSWLGRALKVARNEGQHPPSAFRIRAASGRK